MIGYQRRDGEAFDDYALRLYDNAADYGLTVVRIAELLNAESDIPRGESSLRMYYKGYKAGLERARDASCAAERILCLSDLHCPFQLPVSTFEAYAGRVDILVLNGDIVDGQGISKFQRVYRLSPMEEIIEARNYLWDLIHLLKPKKVIVNYGNHDIRFQSYLAKNLDTDLLELMPKTPLDLIFDDGFYHYDKRTGTKTHYCPLKELLLDVELKYTGKWWCQYKNIIFCHPSAYSSGVMKTSEQALAYFRNEGMVFTELVMAHTHKLGEFTVGNTTLYEQGCCCDITQNNYRDGSLTLSQKEGFLYIGLDNEGKVIRDETKLVRLN